MRINKNPTKTRTFEGTVSQKNTDEQKFIRICCSCLLWENQFYATGSEISKELCSLVSKLKTAFLKEWVLKIRNEYYLRHVPLFVIREMARIDKHKSVVATLLTEVIQRPDELTEFLSIYWKDKRQPLSAQVKKGLAGAFIKFNEYSLAKYNQEKEIKLRDVLFLCHAKPINEDQDLLWKRLISNTLAIPETWETIVKKNTIDEWKYILDNKKLNGLAFLRNLRNMTNAGVTTKDISSYASTCNFNKVLPYRFIAAAKHAPSIESAIEKKMLESVDVSAKLAGKTILLIDVSGSMAEKLSDKSENTRQETACALAILLRELCEDIEIHTFSNRVVEIPNRHGFALRDAIANSQHHGATHLREAVAALKDRRFDRFVIITDEQSGDGKPSDLLSEQQGYIINVASYTNGVGHGDWITINGFSENVIKFMQEIENLQIS